MSRDRRLIDKGADAPLQGLLDQGRYHVKLGDQHKTVLTENGWTDEQTRDLEAQLDALGTQRSRALDERAGAALTTRGEGTAISEAKALIERLRNVVKPVVRKNPSAGIKAEDFNAGGTLGRVASRISEYLGKVRGAASKLDHAFAPYFKGEPLTTLIDNAKKKLDDASSTQAVDHATLPDDTAAVLELKGKVLEAIEELNGVGKNAFEGQAELRGMWNKDILNKARKSRPKKDDDKNA